MTQPATEGQPGTQDGHPQRWKIWNDSTREIGGALGIAVMGTLLSTGYRSGIDDATAGLPPELAELAEDGIGGAFRVAQMAGRPDLIEPAKLAFVDGTSLAFWVAAAIGVVAAVIVALTYPALADEPAPVAEGEPVG